MALGRRGPKQQHLFIAAGDLPRSPGHPFYRKLNELLTEAGFDRQVEELCRPHYADGVGRPSIPPGVYFRMVFIGYFEGIDSQRGIAWRCADSRSLQEFLGIAATESSPDHSSMTDIRQRLPLQVHEAVFQLLLSIAKKKDVLRGKSLGIDSTMLEANAAMKSIVRRDSGIGWRKYLGKLAQREGHETANADDLRRMDRKREEKKVSNNDWGSPTDPDSRIARMKDGTTHLAYKAEHAVDLESQIVVAATIHHANQSDPSTLPDMLIRAQTNLELSGSDSVVKDAVADRGYHSAEALATCQQLGVRAYIAERKSQHRRNWMNKPQAFQHAVVSCRRRTQSRRAKQLQRWRSERVERSFAHICETGKARRTWIRGIESVSKRYLIHVAAHNLAVIMRKLFGFGTPKGLAALGLAAIAAFFNFLRHMVDWIRKSVTAVCGSGFANQRAHAVEETRKP